MRSSPSILSGLQRIHHDRHFQSPTINFNPPSRGSASWPIISLTLSYTSNRISQSSDDLLTRRVQTYDATMLASGFTNAPITQLLLLGVVGSAIIASLTDTKYFLWIEVRPHLLDYWQYWRLLTWQLAYTNSAEVLFAAMTFYQLRVIERLWGSRKFAVGITTTSIRSAKAQRGFPDTASLSNGRLTGEYRSPFSFPSTSTPLSSLPSSSP